jgi:aminopeptidase N
MDLYFSRHDGEAATVEDFIRCFEAAASVDLKQFRLWYSQAGTPELVVKGRYSAAKRTFSLEVEQIVPATPGQPRKKVMHIPLALGLVGARGVDLPLSLDGAAVPDGILHVRKRKETFRFHDVAERPVPSLLRGFSAPVRLTTNTDETDLLFLLAHDSDAFNRWQAAYGCAMRRLTASYAALRDSAAAEKEQDIGLFAEALGRVVADQTLDAAYRAQLLELPGESDVAMALGSDVDPDAVHQAREAMRRALAGLLAPQLEAAYNAFRPNAPYSPDAKSTGRRALRNAALALMAAPGDATAAERVAAHYRAADNMTDMMAALNVITHIDHAHRTRLLDDFRRRFKANALVLDKWYGLEAASTLPGTIERVAELAKEKTFSPYNPNRVRALLGTFASANPTGLHRADGAGYRLIGRHVVGLDRINPQLAARLLGTFKNWKMMEPGRRKAAEGTLREVAGTKALSPDVLEIAQRSLE